MVRMPIWPTFYQAIGLFLLVSRLTQQIAGEDGIIKKIKDFAEWLQGECEQFEEVEAAKEMDKTFMLSLLKKKLGRAIIVLDGGRFKERPLTKQEQEKSKLSVFEANTGLIAESVTSAEAYLEEYKRTGVPKGKDEVNEEYKMLMNLTNLLQKLFLSKAQWNFLERDGNNAESSKMGEKCQNLIFYSNLFNGQYSTTFHKHLDKFEHVFTDVEHDDIDFKWKLKKVVRIARDLLKRLEKELQKHDGENIRKYERYLANVLQNSFNQQMLDLLALEFDHQNSHNKLEQYHNYVILFEYADNLLNSTLLKLSKPNEVLINDFIKNKGNWSEFDLEENGLIQSIKECVVRSYSDMYKNFSSVYDVAKFDQWLPERLMLHTEKCKDKEKEDLRFRIALNALRALTLYGRLNDYYSKMEESRLLEAYRKTNLLQIREEYEEKRTEAIKEMGGYGAKFSEYIFGELSKQSEAKMKEADKAGTKREDHEQKGKGIA